MVVRYNTDGSRDLSFGTDGDGMEILFTGVSEDLLVLPDNKMSLCGSGAGLNFQAARLNSNGAPDTSFGVDGVATIDLGATDTAYAIAVQADGKILLAGDSWQSGGGGGISRWCVY